MNLQGAVLVMLGQRDQDHITKRLLVSHLVGEGTQESLSFNLLNFNINEAMYLTGGLKNVTYSSAPVGAHSASIKVTSFTLRPKAALTPTADPTPILQLLFRLPEAMWL